MSSTEDIAKALTGHDQPAHVCALMQALALYDAYTAQVRESDAEIERRFPAMKPVGPDALPRRNRATTHRTHHKNAPVYDARGLRYQLAGVDLVAIPGLNASTVHTMLSDDHEPKSPKPADTFLCNNIDDHERDCEVPSRRAISVTV